MSSGQTFTDFTFSVDEFDGPVVDPSGYMTYVLSEDVGAFSGSKGITVYRGDRSLVGEIRWKSLFRGPAQISINGNQIDQLFTKSRNGLFSPLHYNFWDERGIHLYWKDYTCYTPEKVPVAMYTSRVKHVFSENEPAVLRVNNAYVESLDYLLFSAIKLEKKRQDNTHAAASSGLAGGGP